MSNRCTTALQSGDEQCEFSAPEWRYSLEGYRFDLRSERWQLSASQAILVEELRQLCWSSRLEEALITAVAHTVENFSSGTVKTVKVAMKKLLEFTPSNLRKDHFSCELLLSFREFARQRFGNDCLVSKGIRPFLRRWNALGLPGVSSDVVEMLDRWRLKGAERNVAVNRLDANSGPLMPDEHVAFAAKLLNAFEKGDISLDDFLLVRLLEVTGRRPTQITQLKLKDMENCRYEDFVPGDSPKKLYLLHVPRVKIAGAATRHAFRSIAVSDGLWDLLAAQRANVLSRLDGLIKSSGLCSQPKDLAEIREAMPLIPEWRCVEGSIQDIKVLICDGHHRDAVVALRALVQDQQFHRPAAYTLATMRKIIGAIDPTNRDGKRLAICSRRFRYTREFDLERAGCAAPVIAWNMDHSSVESLAAYSKNGPDRARTISKAMALKLSPFVKMFQGTLVDSEKCAEGGENPETSRILINGLVPGATCATKHGCGMSGLPRPCYDGCPHFRPWVNGPHVEYLEMILAERERDLNALRPVEDRAVIEAADSLIINIVQVIRLCESRREELAFSSNGNVHDTGLKNADKF